ncbi:hypothetical protein K503DRAFT_356784 [Rhizopogon vinicolor AM-OR11-026]|uniref:Uncharacterized protein n=1 Tax=Rhizopogon vinicolor AM-OR11-026 TaxID=1314800 RepID=A0A1B7MSS4_9AGAM|nr:hypothetical protein K503DRAFT_356784 [Rhizopogon vinicolor AM-OR11-026]
MSGGTLLLRHFQHNSWKSHHRSSCKFLKAAVGSVAPHHVKRSLSARRPRDLRHAEQGGYSGACRRCAAPVSVGAGISRGRAQDAGLSSWRNPRVHQSFLFMVIVIFHRFQSSEQILFSPRTALNMEVKRGRNS